jgi:hypothetical protein
VVGVVVVVVVVDVVDVVDVVEIVEVVEVVGVVTAAAIVVDVAAGGAVCSGTVAPTPLLDEHPASIIAMTASEPLAARRVRIDG